MVVQHSLRRGEPKWLRESRLEAVERFTPDAWPTGEEEEWRRFPLKDLPAGSLVSTLDHLPGIQFKLEPEATAAGVIFKGLLRASLDNPELVRPHIAPGVLDLGFQRFRSARDSDLRSLNVFAGEGRSKVGIESDIEGDGAVVKLFGLVAAGDNQRIDVNSFQRVDGRSSQSDLLYL